MARHKQEVWYTCDRCRTRIDSKHDVVALNPHWIEDDFDTEVSFDLCKNCREQFESFMKAPAKEE